MKIYLIVAKYHDTYADATMPSVVDAWDEYTMDDNPEGYPESLRQHLDQVGRGGYAGVNELTIEIPDEAVRKLFTPDEYVLKAEVLDADSLA